ncbi:hypothetical protein [Marinigracilibium pacificum]|uniref:Uncharacterized protein n=1 Tax=Marinigracilibium pacificum TaxID=2729599 RepID=A0A848J2S2_9BACT|nr:hypothetical protein [Marinigracilibium pacificum]NMM50897.1 hypothetical protein [Marinigracilibium pacificum]
MKKRELKNLALIKIQEGKSRQETLESIKNQTQLPAKDIANILKYIPPLNTRDKHKTLNYILLFILLMTALFKMFAGIPLVLQNGLKWFPILLLLPTINLIMAYGVLKFKGEFYRLIMVLTALSVVRSLGKINLSDIYDIMDLLIAGIVIGLSYFLNKKFTAEVKSERENYIDENGENSSRMTIKFKD